ncbi:MAG: hypothetical protein HZA81_03220 [Candidatus Taylorbacteria bacterium]|nr:hypothetical protein [Candidatus Taylorbacteria bacterium]
MNIEITPSGFGILAILAIGIALSRYQRRLEQRARREEAFDLWLEKSEETGAWLKANPAASIDHPAYKELVARESEAFEAYLKKKGSVTPAESAEQERLRRRLSGIDTPRSHE